MLPSESPIDPPDGLASDIEASSESTWEGGSSSPGEAPAAPRPWGPWATIGWTILCVVVLFVIQFGVSVVFLGVRLASNPAAKLETLIKDLTTDGNLLAVASMLSTSAVLGLIALLVYARRFPIRDYLALTWPSPRPASAAIAGLIVLLVSSDLISYGLGRPISPPFMVEIYRTSLVADVSRRLAGRGTAGRGDPLSWVPVQGNLGFAHGPIAAVFLSSVAWAILHIQYDSYGIVYDRPLPVSTWDSFDIGRPRSH